MDFISVHLALVVSIIFGLIHVIITPAPEQQALARFCNLSKWLCLIAFAAFWLGK